VAAARAAAQALGLFARLDAPRSAEELAAEFGIGARRLSWLLDVLAADGVLVRADGRYGHGAAGPAPAAPGATLIARVLRRDAAPTPAEIIGSVEAAALMCHDGLDRVPAELVARLARLVGDGTLLDAGCGDGRIAEAVLAAAAPRARAVLVERDPRWVARLRGPRVEIVAGELADVALPRARVALVSNVLHMMSAAAAERVVARVAAALEPGGALVVREVAVADDRSGPRFGLAFGLSLAILEPDAELPTPAAITAWLGRAGLAAAAPELVRESVVIQGSAPAVG
jgi:hypothetical protein